MFHIKGPSNFRRDEALQLLPHLLSDLNRVLAKKDPCLITPAIVSAMVAYAHGWDELTYFSQVPVRVSMQTFYNQVTRQKLPATFVYNLVFNQDYIVTILRLLKTRPGRRRGRDIRPRRR